MYVKYYHELYNWLEQEGEGMGEYQERKIFTQMKHRPEHFSFSFLTCSSSSFSPWLDVDDFVHLLIMLRDWSSRNREINHFLPVDICPRSKKISLCDRWTKLTVSLFPTELFELNKTAPDLDVLGWGGIVSSSSFLISKLESNIWGVADTSNSMASWLPGT